MGALTSRQHAGVEVVDISANHAYRYPPKTGCYFGSHFIMGGERFDTTQPEAYLFGENIDLNFLGNRPIPFPYPAPQANEPTKTLKSLVNIRKDSLRFVRAPTESGCGSDENHNSTKYSIEFTFDSDVRCAITIFYFATEEITSSGAVYTSKDPSLTSETFFYKKGASQQFVQSTHVFDPSKYTEDELSYGFDREIIPIVIQCVADEECTDLTWKKTLEKDPKQQHMTFGVVEKNSDGGYTLKPLKQKQFVDGVCYLLQEIYGIENKNAETSKVVNDDEVEDDGSECVICMSDIRDTLILPCRHLCLCNTCADSLRYQANNCPICRAPFRALLQIRALRRKTCHQNNEADDNRSNQNHEHIPHGFEAVSLIEALNGPLTPASHPPQSVATQMPPDDMNSPIAPVQPILPPVGSPTLKTLSRHPSLVEARTNVRKSLEGDPVVVALGDAAITMMTETVLSTDSSPKLSPHEHELGILSQTPLRDDSYDSIYRTPQDSITVVNEVLAGNDFSQPLLKSGYDSARDSPQDSQVSTTHSCLLDEDERSVTPPLEPSPDYQEDDPAPDYSETPELDDASCVLQDIDVRPDDITSSILYTPEDRAESVPLKNPPSYAEAISLPGTPLIGSSNRSSGESFSSTSSTRMLLSEQKREPLDEDRVIM